MDINWKEVLPVVLAIWYFTKKWFDRISAIVEPVIAEAEKLAQDGTIDKKDRKALVMRAISILEAQKTIKLNFLSRMFVSWLVDRVASALPDFEVTQAAGRALCQATGKPDAQCPG